MRWLGIAAAIGAILAAVMNTIWFTRRMGTGNFFSVIAGPAALGTIGIIAFTVLLGVVTVRMMVHGDTETEDEEAREQRELSEEEAGRVSQGSASEKSK